MSTEQSLADAQTEVMVDSTTAVENPAAEGAYRLSLDVKVENSGPCKRHVSVKVPQRDIDHYRNQAIKDLIFNAAVPGFRPGRVPRKLVEKKFRKEVSDNVRQKLLVDSLEQIAEDHNLDAINEPDMDVLDLQLPDTGDFEYEFTVEVRPQFEMPNYKGLAIKRPVRNISDEDVARHLNKLLQQFATLEPVERAVQAGDSIEVKLTRTYKNNVLGRNEEIVTVRPTLAFQDAELQGFDKLLEGANVGDTRVGQAVVSMEAENLEMRGENVECSFEVTKVFTRKLPELTESFLLSLGVENEDDLRTEIRNIIERQLRYEQRQSAREQILAKITESADWDLPESLVRRQVENALRREILEMQQAGFTESEVRARENELRNSAVSTTRQALKEHFVLDRISSEEKIEVQPEDLETEIHLMASQRGESPRRMRARLEKQGMMENLAAQVLERKTIEMVISHATYEDVETPIKVDTENTEAINLSVIGESSRPTAPHTEPIVAGAE